MASLRIVNGPDTGKRFPLDGDSTVIGRLPGSGVHLDSLAISRQHARVVRREGQFFVEDLGSSNGTFLNGQKVTRPAPLADRDLVQVGPYVFALEADPAPAAAAPADEGLVVRERVVADPREQGLPGQDPAHQLQVVLQVAQHLAGTLDLDELLGKLLDQLLGLFPHADRGCVLLGREDNLVPRAQRARRPLGRRAAVHPALARQVLEQKVGILGEDAPPNLSQATALSWNPRSLMCVPLTGHDGRPLGVLQLDGELLRGFGAEDLRVLTAIGLQVAGLIENAAMLRQIPDGSGPVPRPPLAQSPAFSSHTVVTRYPAPIALAYRRFCRQQDAATRLRMLFAALEATLRYLVALGVCDLFRGLAEAGGPDARLPDHAAFDFLRRHRAMPLGMWAEALRETARVSAGMEGLVVPELPAVCAPGGPFDSGLVAGLIRTRNEHIHEGGNLVSTPEECQSVLREARPRLEEALQEVRFVSEYPLGFVRRSPGAPADADRHRYYLHSCMGAHVANTVEAHALEAPLTLRENVPFVVARNDSRLLYLWPLLGQRVAAHTGRHTLYVFEDIPDRHGAYLAEVRSAAIDVRDEWRQVLRRPAPADHGWFLESLRELPAAPAVPPDLLLGGRLLPSSGGKLVGQVLGSNRLLAVAATGGFSTVYSAENLATGERVAVKVLEAPEAQRHLARFRQEFEKLRHAGQHPNIIRCFEWGNPIIGGREYPWYSMEFAVGGDLTGRIEERRTECGADLPWERPALRAQVGCEFGAIAGAVAWLHGLGIVHRDIKPGNVLIMENGELRLTDFGLVKDLSPAAATLFIPRTSTGAVLGTRHYMAPEQERGEEVEKPADVYALGVLLAELATGERPVPHSHVPQGSTLEAGVAVRRLPAPLRRFILRCTDVRPEQRPADGRVMLEEFEPAAAGDRG
jgi:hypothetical protein